MTSLEYIKPFVNAAVSHQLQSGTLLPRYSAQSVSQSVRKLNSAFRSR